MCANCCAYAGVLTAVDVMLLSGRIKYSSYCVICFFVAQNHLLSITSCFVDVCLI
jgi:hypothetical protein